MSHYTTKANAARDVNEWIVEGQKDWPEFKKKMLLKYGYGESMIEKIRRDLEL